MHLLYSPSSLYSPYSTNPECSLFHSTDCLGARERVMIDDERGMILSLTTRAGSAHAGEHLMQANSLTEPTEVPSGPLSTEELRKIDAYWRAANYLSVGQIYLFDNPLLT